MILCASKSCLTGAGTQCPAVLACNFKAAPQKVFTGAPVAAKMAWESGRVAELADAKDLGSFGEILAGSTPVAPTSFESTRWRSGATAWQVMAGPGASAPRSMAPAISSGAKSSLPGPAFPAEHIFLLDCRISPYKLGPVTQLRERFCGRTACFEPGQRARVSTLPTPCARRIETPSSFAKTSQEDADGSNC